MKGWSAKLLCAIAGALLLRSNAIVGAMLGLAIGHAIDAGWFRAVRERPRANPYRVFGLAKDATDAEVDLAYRRLMARHHPDRLGVAGEEQRRQAEATTRDINAAYERIKAMRRRR